MVKKVIHKFGLAYINNNKLLLCEPFAFKDLILPGGVIEDNENYKLNLTREVIEELGDNAKLDLKSLKYLGTFSDVAAGRIETLVEIQLYLGKVEGKLKPSSEIKKLHWFNPERDSNILSPILRNKIIPFLINKKYLKVKSIKTRG